MAKILLTARYKKRLHTYSIKDWGIEFGMTSNKASYHCRKAKENGCVTDQQIVDYMSEVKHYSHQDLTPRTDPVKEPYYRKFLFPVADRDYAVTL